MTHRFQKGMPRPARAGRRAGTPNKSTQDVSQFCREVLETPEFRQKWHEYFTETPLHRIDARLLAIAFAYAYGKPRERLQLTEVEDGPLQPRVAFYLPFNGRDPHLLVGEDQCHQLELMR